MLNRRRFPPVKLIIYRFLRSKIKTIKYTISLNYIIIQWLRFHWTLRSPEMIHSHAKPKKMYQNQTRHLMQISLNSLGLLLFSSTTLGLLPYSSPAQQLSTNSSQISYISPTIIERENHQKERQTINPNKLPHQCTLKFQPQQQRNDQN